MSSRPGQRQALRGALAPVTATLAIQVLMSMATVALPVLAPAAAAGIGVPVAYVGLFVSLIYAASMACGLASDVLVRRLGPLRVSQIGLLGGAAGLALAASGSLPLVLCGALLLGAGYGPVTPASSFILSRAAPPAHLSIIFSIKQTGVPIGGMLAGAVLPAIVLWAGWRAAALAVALACLLTALLVQPLRAALDAERMPGTGFRAGGIQGPMRLLVTDRASRRLALSSFFFAALQLSLVTYLVIYLTRELGFSLVQAGLMLAAAQAAGIAGRLLAGALADRSGRPMQVLGVLGCAMGLSALAAAQFSSHWPVWAMLLTCIAFGASAIGWNGVFLAEVARLAPAGAVSAATSAALFVTYAGILTGPAVFALLLAAGMAYGDAFMLIAAPALVYGLALLRVPREAKA